MKEILDKLSSYNLFNYLLPGVLFAGAVDHLTSHKLIHANIVIGVFFYYFIGLVISRVGSLLLEPTLKKFGFVKYADYKSFVAASKDDAQINVLSEVNNMSRTLLAMLVCIALFVLIDRVAGPQADAVVQLLVLVGLLALFAFAWRKQTNYVVSRVTHHKQQSGKTGATPAGDVNNETDSA